MAYIRTGRRDYHEAYRPDFKARNKTISFTVSEGEGGEAERIDAAAQAAGLTRSAWLTKVVIAALPAKAPEPKPEKPKRRGAQR